MFFFLRETIFHPENAAYILRCIIYFLKITLYVFFFVFLPWAEAILLVPNLVRKLKALPLPLHEPFFTLI